MPKKFIDTLKQLFFRKRTADILLVISLLVLACLPSTFFAHQATALRDARYSRPSSSVQMRAPELAPTVQPFLFGLGAEMDHAIGQRLVKEAPVKMLTSWYNGPNDLGFMRGWKNDLVPNAYMRGYSLHLIVYNNDAEQNVNTAYGPACGRPYPLSARFLTDMQELATIYNGTGTLYISMFTELQTYPCQDNNWVGAENYYKAMQDQYMATRTIFKQYAPNSKISLSWGGWQANWDDPAKGGGKSLFTRFADVMNASDFQSFQAMGTQAGENKPLILRMTKALHEYGNGQVMVAHFKPDNASQSVWDNDINDIFTPSNVAELRANGLFGFSFMDANLIANETSYQKAKSVVDTYAR